MSYFNYLEAEGDVWDLREGDTFSSLGGQEICKKYETPATQLQSGKVGKRQRENKCFPKHDVTKQFRYVGDKIPVNAVVYITEKLHGTSGRAGLVLTEIRLPLFKRWINKLSPIFPTKEYKFLIGSRNVIMC